MFSTFHVVGQNAAITLNPYKKATLSMRNGSTIDGYARFNFTKDLVFKPDEDGEKETYDGNNVSRIVIFSDEDEKTIYEYKKLERRFKVSIVMLELIEEGRVNLYQSKHTSFIPVAAGMGMGSGIPVQQTFYYVSRQGEDFAIKVKNPSTGSRKFKKFATEFLSDCTPIIAKLKAKEFRRVRIKEVMEYYNNTCREVEIQ